MSAPQPKYNVLISGAGPAGLVLAWWLSHYNITSTILERAPHLRAAGQSLEIQGPSLKVVEKMGLLAQFQARKTHEGGLALVDEKNRAYAKVPMDASITFTNEIEVLRGDMVDIWYDAVKDDPNVGFVFGDYIVGVKQDPNQIDVTLASGKVLTNFDLLVVADGMNSKTRGLAFDEPAAVKGLGIVCAFFSIPWEKQDADWARFYSTAGRQVLLRPHAPSGTAAHLGVPTGAAGDYLKLSTKEQKELLHKLFANVGWEAPRVLAGMDAATDFYMAEAGQVRCKTWQNGRVVLLGDSAFCPSPFSGVGVTLSVVGAYVLAGELAADKSIGKAFTGYEEKMRPWVKEAQSITPVWGLVFPKSKSGISVFRAAMRVLLSKGVLGVLSKAAALFQGDQQGFELPPYSQAVAA